MPRQRVDEALVALGLVDSLEMARALTMAGRVYIGENMVRKPSELAKPGLPLSVMEKNRKFVSRGGLKLEKAIGEFGIDIAGKVCIDVGASTGGFTDVMLRAGAARVYSVDVGYGQLDYTLRNDARVIVMERTNARFLAPDMFPVAPSFGATDVSFISLKAVLPAALGALSGDGRRFVALVKPQFEAPAAQVGAKGVVRDPDVHRKVLLSIIDFAQGIGWRTQALSFSPVTGPEGNIEFLLDLAPENIAKSEVTATYIDQIVCEAYDKFVKSS